MLSSCQRRTHNQFHAVLCPLGRTNKHTKVAIIINPKIESMLMATVRLNQCRYRQKCRPSLFRKFGVATTPENKTNTLPKVYKSHAHKSTSSTCNIRIYEDQFFRRNPKINFLHSLLLFRKLSHDMETTKVALENERKIQQLQMQAINALWKKVSTLQPTPAVTSTELQALATSSETINTSSTAVVQDLAKTCSVLTNQVGCLIPSNSQPHQNTFNSF